MSLKAQNLRTRIFSEKKCNKCYMKTTNLSHVVCVCYWLHKWVINELDPLRLNLKCLSLSPDTAFNLLCHLFFHANWIVSLACHIAVQWFKYSFFQELKFSSQWLHWQKHCNAFNSLNPFKISSSFSLQWNFSCLVCSLEVSDGWAMKVCIKFGHL